MSLALLLCLFVLLPCRNSFASFRIRQESTSRSGVFVSAPHAVDREMAFFLTTNRIASLEEYAAWAVKHISYQNENQDEWVDPVRTLRRKYGDCEDIAFLNAATAFVLGYEPEIFILLKKGSAHAICLVPTENAYIWFDNTTFHKTKATSSAQLVRSIQKKYGYAAARKINYRDDPWLTHSPSSTVNVAGNK
ncbi:MAG TPA: hypothetical protein VLJ10_00695 [Candidatus Bathyarchaeia archaeon]|nr:hypothetical protein [Candidatus Bathyarchaeia archaeon]